MTLRNVGAHPDQLLGASTSEADRLELHVMSMAGGVMRMRRLQAGAPLGAGASLRLQPDGDYHFMLIRPKRALKRGDQVDAVLTFAKAGSIKVRFRVEAPAKGE